ncbi:YbhN family protein [Rhodococcus sp. NPDC058514]|uniref:lysylphosphatidylglycerol synthase transmembrane domain-containing protein n=1 Tax=unclassified Rhodococcus (in: high G+C Gram-positive bacteria) TaxID=192944 RepID=UPI003665BC24
MVTPQPDRSEVVPHRPEGATPDRPRGRFWWVKWVAGVLLVALLVGEGVYLWPRLHESWTALSEIHWGWLAACIVAQAVSLSGYGRVQKQLLRAGGVSVGQGKSVSVVYASTAMAVTLPAGQVFSTAFTYRETRRWGASPVVASWQLAISGVIAGVGLALIGVCGALLVGGSVSPFTLTFSVAGLIALIFAVRYVTAHPNSIEAVVRWVLVRVNAMRRKPADTGMAAVREMLEQLDSVQLGKRDGAIALGWSAVHRVGDLACLAAACYAIGADPALSGLLIAFAAGKAVATIPLAPGGLVFVDATLIATLTTAASISASQAVAAAFVYRGVSFILVAIAGWIVFLFLFRRHQHEDLEFDVELERREQKALHEPPVVEGPVIDLHKIDPAHRKKG